MKHTRKNMEKRMLVNVDRDERALSLLGGGLLVLYGLIRLPLTAMALLAGGIYLLYRGVTGYCLLYEKLNINKAVMMQDDGVARPAAVRSHPSVEKRGVVTEASWESFPASDPPAWSGRGGS